MKELDTDNNGVLDEEEIKMCKIDLAPVYELEKAIERAAKLVVPALFVPESEIIVKRRRIERALIEGVKDDNAPELRAALEDFRSHPELGVAMELVAPAEQIVQRVNIEDMIESGVADRDKVRIVDAMGRAGASGTAKVKEFFMVMGKAMVEKLDGFDVCQQAMDAQSIPDLKQALQHMNEGWWMAEHWYAADKQHLRTFQLAYKRLTVLGELQRCMEPLQIAPLQAAYDTAIEVHVTDALVDKAAQILQNIDRKTVQTAFQTPHCAGGPFAGDTWTANPQFRVTLSGKDGAARPDKVTISLTMAEGGEEEGTGTQAGDFFGQFAVHVCVNKDGKASEEVMDGCTVLGHSEYDDETAILTVPDIDSSQELYIVPSTKIAGEDGPFVIRVLCETPGGVMNIERVVKTGDLVLQAIAADDLVELARLLDHAKAKGLQRVHGSKGKSYLARRLKENALRTAVDAGGPLVAVQEGLDGAAELGVAPSMVQQAQQLEKRLLAIAALESANAENAWEKLEAAISQARSALVDESIIKPFLRKMLELRAASRLRACLARGEDGYTELQAMYDEGLAVALMGDDMMEAKRILELVKDSQRHFNGHFEPWMGGSKDSVGTWVDNPHYKLTVGDTPMKMSISVDKEGGAEFGDYAVHVVKPTFQGVHNSNAVQLGEDSELAASTEYDTATSNVTLQCEARTVYFVVVSRREGEEMRLMSGGFSVTTIGIGKYTLEEPPTLIQVDIRAAMNAKTFDKLPALIERAEGPTIGLSAHALVAAAKLISEIERGWQQRSAELMGIAIRNAKQAKVDRFVLKTYKQRYKQLAIEAKLARGLEDSTAELLAAWEEARLIEYSAGSFSKAAGKVAQFKQTTTIVHAFLDEQAAGAPRFGNWRQNATWRLTVKEKTTIYVAINADGILNDAAKAKIQKKEDKKEAAFLKAVDKQAAMEAAAAADEKNEEVAAAAKDAKRVVEELEAVRQLKKQRAEDGESGEFGALGVHLVRNTRESWIPGVLSGYNTLSCSDAYLEDQGFVACEVDPAEGSVFVVPSTFNPGEEGAFTLSLMANNAFDVEEVEEFEGNMISLKANWTKANQGPRHKKNGGNELAKNFKIEKTWNKNPQFRVWLTDPDEADTKHTEVVLQIVLSTPIEGAQIGLHVMRNTFCQFYNEKIEVLADRYQKLVAKTASHEAANEIALDINLEDSFEVKKNGCESGFPFFIVPSMLDKKADGPLQLLVYSNKPVVVQVLDDEARKL